LVIPTLIRFALVISLPVLNLLAMVSQILDEVNYLTMESSYQLEPNVGFENIFYKINRYLLPYNG
jgi:hypothetical protein